MPRSCKSSLLNLVLPLLIIIEPTGVCAEAVILNFGLFELRSLNSLTKESIV